MAEVAEDGGGGCREDVGGTGWEDCGGAVMRGLLGGGIEVEMAARLPLSTGRVSVSNSSSSSSSASTPPP